jgi:hypothetical protein
VETMTEKEIYQALCLSCGMAIKTQEIAVQITGQTIDFNERIAIQNTNYYLCSECSEKSKAYLSGGMKKATERRNDLKAQCQEIDLNGFNGAMIIGS